MSKEINREIALAALLANPTITDAARNCGLSEKTLRRYLADAEFQTEFRVARRVVFEQNVNRLQTLHGEAVDTLARNLNCENPSTEVRSAQIILDNVLKSVELMDIAQRLDLLESSLGENKKNEYYPKPINETRKRIK